MSVGRARGQLPYSLACAKVLASARRPGRLPMMLACGSSLRLTKGLQD